jgi:hypothetical protein
MANVERILIRGTGNGPPVDLERAQVAPGEAIAGDRYAPDNASGTFYEEGKDGQDVTLIEAEALEDTGLSAEESGRNLVTRGVRLNDLVGRRFTIGAVELEGNRLCDPCATLRDRTGVFSELVGRGGLRADVLVGGEIAVGDELEVL